MKLVYMHAHILEMGIEPNKRKRSSSVSSVLKFEQPDSSVQFWFDIGQFGLLGLVHRK